MKNIEFSSDEVKKQYKKILAEYEALSGVMIYEFELKENKIKIEEINTNLNDISIIVNDGNKMVTVVIDSLNKKIRIDYLNKPYVKIFDNIPRKYIIPDGYEYQQGSRIIFRKYLVKLNNYGNKNVLSINDNNMIYGISITGGNKDFNIEDFIKKILNYSNPITNIRELLLIISKIIDLTYFDLKLSDMNGSTIKICYNLLENYIEYRENETEKQKIYLKNHEFIVERRIKEKYDDDITPLIKKIGVRNGKEKG